MAVEEKAIADDLSPRTTPFLVGHKNAVDIFLKTYASGRLHHAWLLAGPKGIGKATLAYHLARFLLKEGAGGPGGPALFGEEALPVSLEVPVDDPVFIHVANGADGNLKVIERGLNEKTKKMRQEIIVDDVRSLHNFFEKTAAQEGWRIAIVDCADEMNRNAANALLKMLEEPPSKSILFLVSHTKGRLPATIRSRCQQLMLNPLSDGQVQEVLKKRLPGMGAGEIKTLSEMAGGAPGLAVRMSLFKGMTLYKIVQELLAGKIMKTKELHDFATKMATKGQDERYFLFLDTLQTQLAALIRQQAGQGGPKTELDCWLQLWDKVTRMRGEGEGLNMGRRQSVLLLISALEDAHKKATAAA